MDVAYFNNIHNSSYQVFQIIKYSQRQDKKNGLSSSPIGLQVPSGSIFLEIQLLEENLLLLSFSRALIENFNHILRHALGIGDAKKQLEQNRLLLFELEIIWKINLLTKNKYSLNKTHRKSLSTSLNCFIYVKKVFFCFLTSESLG